MQTYGPVAVKFPGLSSAQTKWLEDQTAHINETERDKVQQELYRKVLPITIARKFKEDRIIAKNELYAKSFETKDAKQANTMQSQVRMEDLADIVKEKRGLKVQTPTEVVMKGLVKDAEVNGVNPGLINDFLAGKGEEFLYQMGFKERPKKEQEQGGLKGMLSRAGGNRGYAEWPNIGGRAMEIIDDWVQKIPTVNFDGREEELRKRIDEVGETERQNFEEKFNSNRTLQVLYGNVDNYIKESKKTFMDQLLGIGDEGPNFAKQMLNVPGSFLKTATGIGRALTNPLDTVMGLKNVLGTEEGRQAVLDRYGKDFMKTLEEDPIGLASDVLSLVGMGGGVVAKGAKLAGLESTAGKLGKFAAIADGAGNLGLDVAKAGAMQGLETLGSKGGMLGKAVVKGIQFGQEPLKVAGDVAKGIVKALPSAEHTLQNMNRLTKGEQAKFSSMVGESQGEWMNKRGIVAGGEAAIDQLADYFINNKKKVDEALLSIEGEYKNPFLDMMAKESAEFAENTLNKGAERMKELAQKAEAQGLTMSEINEVKRFYEKNNKFTYGKDITAGEKSVRATNIDNNVREWQIDLAEENGFTNLREMNKETQASKFLLDKLVKNTDGSFGNNFFTLTDYITAVGLGSIDPSMITSLIGKKILGSNRFRTNYAKLVNRINGHQTIAEKIADIEAIKKIQSKKELEKFLALEYNPEVGDTKTFLGNGEKIIAGKHGSVREGQILEFNSNKNDLGNNNSDLSVDGILLGQEIGQQTSQIKGGIQENDGEISRGARLKGNIERSDGKGLGKLREGAETKYQLADRDMDKAYAEAVKAGDEARAKQLLKTYAESKGYMETDLKYRDAHHAPMAEIKKADFRNLEKLQELADESYDLNLYAMAHDISLAPQDYFSSNGARWYGYNNAEGMESFRAIKSALDDMKSQIEKYGEIKEVPEIKVYRAVPKELKEGMVQSNGQWVSPSRTYAQWHGESRFDGKYKLLEENVPADQLWWDANDINEWGFDSGEENLTKSTKNSRKLLEITYDENGELIPLSKRFNSRNADARYQSLENPNQKHGVANPLEKSISAQRATQLENIRNGKSVQELADHYSIDIKTVEKITTPEGLKAYGKYGDGIITLAEKIKEGTAPHELFHATFDLVDSNRKENILKQIRESKGLDNLNAEEYLADSFSEYFRTGKFDTKSFGKGLVEKIKQYFYQVKQFITGASKNKAQIKKLFDEILDGEIDREMLGEILGNKKNGIPLNQLHEAKGSIGTPLGKSIVINQNNASQFNLKLGKVQTRYTTPEKFLNDLKQSLNVNGESSYISNNLKDGRYTLRISNHNANARNNKLRGNLENNTSVVIKLSDSRFRADKSVDLIEFVYNPENLTPEKMQGIIKGVQDWIDTGNYTDKGYDHTHKSIRASLGNGEMKYQRV